MKKNASSTWTAWCLAVLTASVVFQAAADQGFPAVKPHEQKTQMGTVTAVDPQQQVVSVRGWTMLNRKFNLGDSCAYTLFDRKDGSMTDLRPGQKVAVAYRNANGVLVADRITQLPMSYEGTVKAIDPGKRLLILRSATMSHELRLADDTRVSLRNDRSGALADIRPGHHVTVFYETPGGRAVVRQIAQSSQSFNGSLTAIDVPEKTLKARSLFGSKKFHVADNCTVVINGRSDARLTELRPGDSLTFTYDEIDGINVVNRIATEAAVPQHVTAQTGPSF